MFFGQSKVKWCVKLIHCTCERPCLRSMLTCTNLRTQGSEWFKSKVDIEVSRASEKAIETIEKHGGTIVTSYYNKLGLRVLLKPWKFDDNRMPRRALPKKKIMPYYLNSENRW